MKKLILAAIAIVIVSAGTASAQINEILKRMDAHYRALDSFTADVTREVTDSALGETDRSSGNVLFVPNKKKPKELRFRLNWVTPRIESISVINGEYRLYVKKQGRLTIGKANSDQVKSKGGNALAVMSMTKQEIKTNYEASYIGVEQVGATSTVRIKLIPKTKADFRYIELWVDGDGMPIQAKIVKPNNDTDQIRFANIKKNVPIKGSQFEIDPPPGTQIVEG